MNSNKELLGLWLSRYHMSSIAVADKINLFSSINSEINTVELISEYLNLDINGIDAITCLLSSLGILVRNKNKIMLNEVSLSYLLTNSELYWGNVLDYTRDTLEYHVILDSLLNRKISNKSTQLNSLGVSFSEAWKNGSLASDETIKFMNIMDVTIFAPATQAIESGIFSQVTHLLDVGGGSGCFVKMFLAKYPQSRASIFELPQTCNILKKSASIYDLILEERLRLCNGNFFVDELPRDVDGILFSNVLHDWSINKIKFLLEKAYKALPDGGKIFIHEMLLNEEKNGPLNAATFNLFMYSNYYAQQLSFSELEAILTEVGFNCCIKYQSHLDFSVTIATKC